VEPHVTGAVLNRNAAYLHAASEGVGASAFITDYANAFNFRAAKVTDPRRFVVVRFHNECRNVKHFMDLMAKYLKAPLTSTELRFRSADNLASALLGRAQLAGVCCIAFDHLSRVDHAVRRAIADLMILSDPIYDVQLEPEYAAPGFKMGIVLVDHLPPEEMFAAAPEVLPRLTGNVAVYPTYENVEVVADAVRQARIGLETFDLGNAEDRLLAEHILEESNGLVVRIASILSVMDYVARRANINRPTLDCFFAATKGYRKLYTAREYAIPDISDNVFYSIVAKRVKRVCKRPLKSADLREKRNAIGMADRERRRMLRHSHGSA
jgi:hypothetical protein